jgi:hypothetical protein
MAPQRDLEEETQEDQEETDDSQKIKTLENAEDDS